MHACTEHVYSHITPELKEETLKFFIKIYVKRTNMYSFKEQVIK